ncbi:hypothetical protein TanjilG_07763 [Lupinus angustifolius]|uniref:Uncharacterized protein n=1 Tax=Lupinus angustifolius TaxID=3871 RepID=A0A1J7IG67_LUPAN|nr:PREDICTED: disease resistance protein RPM1-like [Lupinus angustifolius]OIW13157.1 hypothetical protein TanjilG_07763 [Lupinus angustifolius]
MAETTVSLVLNEMYKLLSAEVNLQTSVHNELAELKDELESIQAYLKDADTRAAAEVDNKEGVKVWVKKLREASFHIEDVIDEYLIYETKQTYDSGCIALLRIIIPLIETLIARHRIVYQIRGLKLYVHEIKARSERYNFHEEGSLRNGRGTQHFKWDDPRLGSLIMEEAEVVGFENPREELVHWLVNGETSRTVVSVFGMGGLGKTTLANNVFHNNTVKDYFHCRAFITVSQTYTVDSLLKDMMKQFHKENNDSLPLGINTMDGMSLVTEVRSYLQNKRYLIVFDDVWKEIFWDEIQNAMLENKGSRIMITTRNLDVANYCKKSSNVRVHNLQPLPTSKAWELFCKKTFRFSSNGNCPLELQNTSHEIVKKCEGLPLAIVAIGGLLSTKDKTVLEWKKLCQNLSSELQRNPHLASLTRILALSYDDLPDYLKSCILYFGIYPEDSSIRCTRIIRQWIAEGFVIHEENKTLEEVAKEYLTELVHRSLVHVSKVNYNGKPSNFRIHDLLHDMMVSKMKDFSFCHVVRKDDQDFYHDLMTRRLSIATSSIDVLMSIKQSKIRSMYMFEREKLSEDFLSRFFAKSILLKVLDLEGASLDYVPDHLGNIFHLRFLSLRKTKVKDLPKSIGKLQNLETLDLKETPVHDLPRDICKLTKLRHLLVCCRKSEESNTMNYEIGMRMNKGIGCLQLLQTLYHVDLDHGGLDLIKELKMLRKLQKLGLKNVKREYGKALCDSIQEMNHLESLSVSGKTEVEIIDLQHISSPPQLRRLDLFACLEKLPDWISRLSQLVRLSFRYSKLTSDPLKSLKHLPNLMRLTIAIDAYDGDTLHIEAGFPKLKRLKLSRLQNLNSIVVDNGALPAVKIIRIGNIPHLKDFPSGFHLLQSLETLYLNNMSPEFNRSIDPNDGSKYWEIKHVQLVSMREGVDGRYSYSTIRHPRNTT